MKKSVKFLLAAGVISAGVIVAGCQSANSCEGKSCPKAEKQCAKVCKTKCVIDRWAFDCKYGACWMGIEKGADGKLTASILWGGGSPVAQSNVKADGNVASMERYDRKDKDPAKTRLRVTTITVNECGKTANVSVTFKDGNGKVVGNAYTCKANRIPALPPAPCLKNIVYDKPINLLAGGMDGWEMMNKKIQNGWSMKDGVLSNRVVMDDKGHPKGRYTNIKTKRADFYDFNLKYEVRVLPKCNSGVYLRGNYEIQVYDTYGKPVDCHHMAAFYGRITPTVAAEKPANEWQTVDVTLYKRHVTVILNGVKIIDNKPVMGITGGAMTSNEFVPGPIYLQGDHTSADFRNMVLTPIIK